ncbi:Vacuolar protein sorting-associated protein 29 [Tritrichomonas foetus]|uniref:Vacuolar protein sorting-associated protein 29 n=1 Tax=Tritrichomonas foetus TaxID=1144522 RepID=A0A1J4KB65_9EUKA|nr:Vacuolar protein sorting-associated protein 29 [Tritrichomonas foetus]|eukprot:OHT06932.1 Vacuolar protein sorting-associated protein 29 [Tritrichomonas foetus]
MMKLFPYLYDLFFIISDHIKMEKVYKKILLSTLHRKYQTIRSLHFDFSKGEIFYPSKFLKSKLGKMLVLLIGDLHIPYRAHEILKVFREHLQPGKIHQILCTGNVCIKSELDYLRTICNEIVVVKGEYDEEGISSTEQTVLTIGGFKVGLISSYSVFPITDQSRLALKQRELDVDILVHGGTHQADASVYDNCFYLNPGSATGAYISEDPHPTPSFILLNVQGTTAIAYLYTLGEEGNILVNKVKFSKDEE